MINKLYFVTGNKNKVEIFNKVMRPQFAVFWFKPPAESTELALKSVEEVVKDKLKKAYSQFNKKNAWLFVTDVGLYIDQFDGRPGALIKRETNELFGGDFSKWCGALDLQKSRRAYIQMVIAAKNLRKGNIITNHKVMGYIPSKPLAGKYGFDWDEIFVPDPSLVLKKYKRKSFAQIPDEEKFRLLMHPAIEKFKKELCQR